MLLPPSTGGARLFYQVSSATGWDRVLELLMPRRRFLRRIAHKLNRMWGFPTEKDLVEARPGFSYRGKKFLIVDLAGNVRQF